MATGLASRLILPNTRRFLEHTHKRLLRASDDDDDSNPFERSTVYSSTTIVMQIPNSGGCGFVNDDGTQWLGLMLLLVKYW